MIVCVCVYIYIYIEREREKEKESVRNYYVWHQVKRHIQRALFRYASFTGVWYKAGFSVRGRHPSRLAAKTAWLIYSADFSPWLTLWVENYRLYIFFWRPHIILSVQFTWHFRCPLFTVRHSCISCLRNPH